MELFNEKGCLTNEALAALQEGTLDELARLEAAEHLAYCDRCMDRYTLLLSQTALEQPSKPLGKAVRQCLWVRAMQTRLGRGAVACAAAVMAIGLWSGASTLMLSPAARALPPERPAITAPDSCEFLEAAKHPRSPAAPVRAVWQQALQTIQSTTGGFDHEK